ncbi:MULTISPECIES: hypothetical protein [unclassified Streptomyces]|uniref:hypothetical protein n=1 Tax=unclassified Streptomyces TaxID=2593676 RepID=UPI00081E2600|nr:MULTISPECIES: hypothetical protein [unclassified Streptomyces]MYR27829.1 hypothetical protein [Streptomyces sp. SID4945]SCF29877.1 hypothetical protein GA0115257_110355 [Streptomyces sp. LcepLS]
MSPRRGIGPGTEAALAHEFSQRILIAISNGTNAVAAKQSSADAVASGALARFLEGGVRVRARSGRRLSGFWGGGGWEGALSEHRICSAGGEQRVEEVVVERETWTDPEFGSEHEGWVGVLLEDGTVPPPVFFGSESSAHHSEVAQWSVYSGRYPYGPRAAALRGACACGWTGPAHVLDWDQIGDRELQLAGANAADNCVVDWDAHTEEVRLATIALPTVVSDLLGRLTDEIEKLTRSSPLAAARAAHLMQVAAKQVGRWPAQKALNDADRHDAAVALGVSENGARSLLAHLGDVSLYG